MLEAEASSFTVILTNSDPASYKSFICLTVDLTSDVSVFVIDWILILCADPINIFPIATDNVGLLIFICVLYCIFNVYL